VHVGCGLHTELKNVIQGRKKCNKTILKDGVYYLIDPHPIEGFYRFDIGYRMHSHTYNTIRKKHVLKIRFFMSSLIVMLLITVRDNDMINLKQRG
jgi:hypothetical protein